MCEPQTTRHPDEADPDSADFHAAVGALVYFFAIRPKVKASTD
jgi:hypothetical protein